MASFKLNLDKSLLCPEFDGYKLSSGAEVTKVCTEPLSDGLCKSSTTGASYLQTRLDSLHNCLVTDLTDTSATDPYTTVYCVNKLGQVLAYDYSTNEELCASRVVWQTELQTTACIGPQLLMPPADQPPPSERESSEDATFGALRPSLVFAGPCLAVFTDGRSDVSVLNTGDRSPQAHHTWMTSFTASVGSCKVLDARLSPSLSADEVEEESLQVLLVSVAAPACLPVPPPTALRAAPSLHLVSWLTLSRKHEDGWSVTREICFVGDAALQYCHFDATCSSVVLLTHHDYRLLHHSDGLPQTSSANGEDKKKVDSDSPVYVYQQTDDDVTLRLGIGGGVSGDDVRVVVSSSHVTVTIRSSDECLFNGTWLHRVEPETVTWIVEGGGVEVSACKAETGLRWETLLQETEPRGVEGSEDDHRLQPLTSNAWGGDNELEDEKPPYNPGQLESCDDADNDLLLMALGPASNDTKMCTNLGNTQYLATIPTGCGSPPAFCLRHDVDGLTWRLTDAVEPQDRFTHSATFHAFGYVKASKQMAKYTSAPTDCSYVAVADVRSHVYVFCQPMAMGSELRNRRTGHTTSTIARQLLLSVPSPLEIMGLATLANVVFLCTEKDVYAYALKLADS